MDWITESLDWLWLVLLACGVWWLMPRTRPQPRLMGYLLVLIGTALGLARLHMANESVVETILFSVLSAAAIFCAVLMITNRNPVYSALWFALVTLNVCGLFLLQLAPFLAAATVIVYAGAIVVTFVFVIMLAQQGGATVYDQRSRQPVIATLGAFTLLALIVGTLEQSASVPTAGQPVDAVTETVEANAGISTAAGQAVVRAELTANPLSRVSAENPRWTLRALGRSLFGDYLFAVELAGTLLLVALIGAIAIAPRRARGTL